MPQPSEPQSCPEPPIVKRNGFQIYKEVFSVGGVDRVSGSRLLELFNPTTLRLKRDQKDAAEEARKLFKKTFYVAQLKHYGVPHKASSTSTELWCALHDACNQVPSSVKEVEASMRRSYEPLRRKWERDYAGWSAAKKRRDDEAFNNCQTPGEKANFDLNRFMDLYYLTDGQPDPAKTPEPQALYGFGDRGALHEMAERIPGLETYSGGSSSDRTICIGWDRGKVWDLAGQISGKAYEAEKVQKKAKRDKQLEIHQNLVASKRSKGTTSGAGKRLKPFSLDSCRGSYVIECDKITDGWSSDIKGDKLTMDISGGKGDMLLAACDFGIIEGTMMLSLSKDTIETIAGEASWDQEASSSDEEDDVDDDGVQILWAPTGKKRKHGKAHAKRRKTTATPPSCRVYFGLRGRDTGSYEIFSDPEPGHIDFLSGDCTKFEGVAYSLQFVGQNVKFRGYKVSDLPQARPEKWESFSEGAYEYERVNRW